VATVPAAAAPAAEAITPRAWRVLAVTSLAFDRTWTAIGAVSLAAAITSLALRRPREPTSGAAEVA
jgi:hypothetical protein